MAAFGRILAEFPWKAVGTGVVVVGGMNVVAVRMGLDFYQSVLSGDEDMKRKDFRQKFGRPTEADRLRNFSSVAEFWDTNIEKWDEKYNLKEYRSDVFGGARGEVLEVGIGTGRCFESVEAGRIKKLVAVDAVKNMLKVAAAKIPGLPYPVDLVLADMHELPFEDEAFDTIISCQCLCSAEDPELVLKEMVRVCKRDGYILLLENGLAESWIIRWAQAFLNHVPDTRHAWAHGSFDDMDLQKLMRTCPVSVRSMKSKGMGNWYLIKACPRHDAMAIPTTSPERPAPNVFAWHRPSPEQQQAAQQRQVGDTLLDKVE
jgi:ubiquinone/menaquinone biosynthesis C-methylase UbiE